MKTFSIKNIIQFTLIFSLIFYLILPLGSASAASTSTSCAVTKVGSPPGDAPTLPKECTQEAVEPGTGQPGQPLPSSDTAKIKEALCVQYKVCPTESTLQPPSSAWTLDQLTALWNLVQKIYMSPTYKTLAIGNYQLELTRAQCYPGGCDGTWGYYAGQVYPGWGKISGARLIVITDNINLAQSQLVMEWLFAHEIGHSASGGLPDGSLGGYLGQNSAYQAVQSCGSIVSNYGYTNWNENNSEILAFYMTAGEEAIGGYLGPSKNLARDFTCIYNMTKQHYFNGIEY